MQKLGFNLEIKPSLLLFLIFIAACKPLAVHEAPFSFVTNLSIGVYEYNEHTVNIEPLFHCADQPYCSTLTVSFPAKTKEVFASIGWGETVLKDFLQTESYQPYKDQVAFHLLVFLFQSQGVTYIRVVNRLAQTVTTRAITNNQKLDMKEILSSEYIVFIHSKPTLADIYVDGSLLSEAPLWLHSVQKTISVQCKLPESASSITRFEKGSSATLLCQL